MFPLGFLLVLRSNQAYDRYNSGIGHYVSMLTAANQLCRQTVAYVCLDDDGNRIPAPEPGDFCEPGKTTCDDPAKERIIRHSIAFMAAVRQDIRLTRCAANGDLLAAMFATPTAQGCRRRSFAHRAVCDRSLPTREDLSELSLHVTKREMDYLEQSGVQWQLPTVKSAVTPPTPTHTHTHTHTHTVARCLN